MNKLIVVTAALASVTLLSGCKHVVVHRAHTPDVVVDTRHHHEYRDVRVIRHEKGYRDHHRGRGHGRPGHHREKVIVVNPPARSARYQRDVARQQERRETHRGRHDARATRSRREAPRRDRHENARRFERRETVRKVPARSARFQREAAKQLERERRGNRDHPGDKPKNEHHSKQRGKDAKRRQNRHENDNRRGRSEGRRFR